MAKDFEQVEAEAKTGGNVTLDAEAQQSREAGKQLAEEGSEQVGLFFFSQVGQLHRWAHGNLEHFLVFKHRVIY